MHPEPEPDAPTTAIHRVYQLLLQQQGVARSEQLHELGVSQRRIYAWVRSGMLLRSGKSVLYLPHLPQNLLTESLIAGHHAHRVGALTGPSAAAVSGRLDRPPWNVLPHTPQPWLVAAQKLSGLNAKIIRQPPGPYGVSGGVPVVRAELAILHALRFWPDEAEASAFAQSLAREWGRERAMRFIDSSVGESRARGNPRLRRMRDLIGASAGDTGPEHRANPPFAAPKRTARGRPTGMGD
jgi:hypothetical protein